MNHPSTCLLKKRQHGLIFLSNWGSLLQTLTLCPGGDPARSPFSLAVHQTFPFRDPLKQNSLFHHHTHLFTVSIESMCNYVYVQEERVHIFLTLFQRSISKLSGNTKLCQVTQGLVWLQTCVTHIPSPSSPSTVQRTKFMENRPL